MRAYYVCTLFNLSHIYILRERERELAREKDLQHLAHVAGAEDLVHDGKLVGIVRREEGGEDAVLGAPPPQEFAGSTRRIATHNVVQINKL